MTHGGMGYAQEYHVERYFREVLVPRIAPVRYVYVPRRYEATGRDKSPETSVTDHDGMMDFLDLSPT